MSPNLISIFNYEDTEFSSGIRDTSIPVVMMYCMPIELIDPNVTTLLSSSTSAVEMPLDADENWQSHQEQKQLSQFTYMVNLVIWIQLLTLQNVITYL